MTHKEKAQRLLEEGYHCSQALFGAFADELGMDMRTAFKISTCFGGGMRQGGLCGCITASLLVLGMALGFYDPKEKEQEVYGNKKTDEFIHRFTERMEGDVHCRDILGKDISKPKELAEIRGEGLILKKCPRAINVSIEILEDMLGEVRLEQERELNLSLEGLIEDEELQSALRRTGKLRRFQSNVTRLVHSAEGEIAFIQFDIRKFKIINDLYGEHFGNEVLSFILDELGRYCEPEQYFVNLRSDVFMLVTEYKNQEELIHFIEELDGHLSSYNGVALQMHYGVYTVEDRHMELRQMEDRAGMARKASKENAVAKVVFYKEQFKESLYLRKFIEENMHAAVNERQFMMYLQPKYSISKNEIVGSEALIRWRHPERGMIYPNEFIPILEENGFIRRADYFIWEEACRFIRQCREENLPCGPVSVNVSRAHLQGDEYLDVLTGLVEKYGIPKEMLELEITETVDDPQVSEKTQKLKDRGFTLLMDDFGSGYSSLNILLETQFDVIKLDKKFMESMMVSEKGKLILEHVVLMARSLDIGLVAEGVEEKDQVEFLRRIGCDKVQGYYFAKPMPEEDFIALLQK